jgi:septal ring-binding cell division protein DamX
MTLAVASAVEAGSSFAAASTQATAAPGSSAAPAASLLEQRLAATHKMLSSVAKGNASIQLFYTENAQSERMEGFLRRAQKLGKLQEIYILPITLNGRDAYRVLYGIFQDSDAARIGMNQLPGKYLDAFAPTLHLLDNSQNVP